MREIDWKSCESMAEIPEQERLEYWAQQHCESLGRELRILEIGAFKGQSTSIFAQFGDVLTIDLHGNVDQGLRNYDQIGKHHYEAFIDNMVRLQLIERVHLITSTSKALDVFPAMNFDVIYVDAGHAFEDVKLDIERSKRHLRQGGLFIFDDYARPGFGYPPFDPEHPHHGPRDPWSGVKRAVDELISEGDHETVEHYLGKICLRRQA